MREFIIPFGSYVIHLNFLSPHAFEIKFSNESSESIKIYGPWILSDGNRFSNFHLFIQIKVIHIIKFEKFK